MAMRPPLPSIALSRRAKAALWTVAILIALIIIVVQLTGVYINFLWYDSVGFRSVYTTIFWTRATLFLIFGTLMALVLGGNMVISYLLSPPFRPMSPEQQNIERYRSLLEPRRFLVLFVVSAIALLSAGLSAQNNWATWQLWLHGGSFGQRDPQFHLDVSFYAFDYPAYRLLLGFGFTAIIFAIILSALVHYLTGAIRLQTPGPKMTVAARRHLTLLVFVFVVLKAMAYWLDRYGLMFSDRAPQFTGASYTDVHAVLPARTILFWIALLIAAGLIASLWLRNTMLPGIAFVSMLVLSILISGIYPAVLQNFSVKPNASSKEAPYITRNIDATRAAYGINNVKYVPYAVNAKPDLTAPTETNNATLSNIRILDPNIVSSAFLRYQQENNQYGFANSLDLDRYKSADGQLHDYVVGVREIDTAGLSGDQTNWINLHTNYTHGFGFVAANAGTDVTNGAPFAEGGLPPSGFLSKDITNNQVYYGELLPSYSIVGAKGRAQEFNGDGSHKITYAGSGGVPLSSVFTRLAFAINYHQTNFLLNDAAAAPGSRIIFNRDPRAAVQKAAPFLKVDSDPYPIVDTGSPNDPSSGHLVWMVDAYTTMDNYPYSSRQSLSNLTNDTLAESNRTAKQPNDQINYIRNSVKATVDAYTGKVTLYAWDEKDPVLAAWRSVFPGLVQPQATMPASIREHVRYPQDLFKVQRTLLGTYHVSDAATFYGQQQKWTVPIDNTDSTSANGNQPPYYVLAAPPNGPSTTPEFQLTSAMNINGRPNLSAYMSANNDPSGDKYGQITVLELPQASRGSVEGPDQVYNRIVNNNTINKDTLYATGGNGAAVIHGNLLTLPLDKSFLYVEPLYRASSTTASGALATLQRVIVYYGGKFGYGATLADALSDFAPNVCTGHTLQLPCDQGSGGTPPSGTPSGSPTTAPTSPGVPSGSTTVPGGQVTIGQIDQAVLDLKQAYKTGDPVKIAQAQVALQKLVERYQASGSPSPARHSPGSATSSPKPARTSGSR